MVGTKQIKLEEPNTLLTHCFTHSLNLAVGKAIKVSKVMKNSLETTFEITKLTKKLPKRDGKVKDIKTAIEQEEVSDITRYILNILWSVEQEMISMTSL